MLAVLGQCRGWEAWRWQGGGGSMDEQRTDCGRSQKQELGTGPSTCVGSYPCYWASLLDKSFALAQERHKSTLFREIGQVAWICGNLGLLRLSGTDPNTPFSDAAV